MTSNGLMTQEDEVFDAVDAAAVSLLLRSASHPTAASPDPRHLKLAWCDTVPRLLGLDWRQFDHWATVVLASRTSQPAEVAQRVEDLVESLTSRRPDRSR